MIYSIANFMFTFNIVFLFLFSRSMPSFLRSTYMCKLKQKQQYRIEISATSKIIYCSLKCILCEIETKLSTRCWLWQSIGWQIEFLRILYVPVKVDFGTFFQSQFTVREFPLYFDSHIFHFQTIMKFVWCFHFH